MPGLTQHPQRSRTLYPPRPAVRYRGNCGGYIKGDLLRYFRSQSVLDPMTSSGTCAMFAANLAFHVDRSMFAAADNAAHATGYAGLPPVDFVWLHPPYWRTGGLEGGPALSFAEPSKDSAGRRCRLSAASRVDAATQNQPAEGRHSRWDRQRPGRGERPSISMECQVRGKRRKCRCLSSGRGRFANESSEASRG